MAIFYHGSSVLFHRFDLSHVLEGDGKVKFGYGVYLTSNFKSAAHYSGANKTATTHFVYTVEVPELTEDNHIDFKKSVHPDIIKRAELKLGAPVPQKITLDGKDFRKYLAKVLGGPAPGHGPCAQPRLTTGQPWPGPVVHRGQSWPAPWPAVGSTVIGRARPITVTRLRVASTGRRLPVATARFQQRPHGQAQKSYSRPGLGRELFFGLRVIKAGRIDFYKVPKIGIMYFYVCLSFAIQKTGPDKRALFFV